MSSDKETALYNLWLASDDSCDVINGVCEIIDECISSNINFSLQKQQMVFFALRKLSKDLSEKAESAEVFVRSTSKS